MKSSKVPQDKNQQMNFFSQQFFLKKSVDITPQKLNNPKPSLSKSPLQNNKYGSQNFDQWFLDIYQPDKRVRSMMQKKVNLIYTMQPINNYILKNSKKLFSNPSFTLTTQNTNDDDPRNKRKKKTDNTISHNRQMSKVCIMDIKKSYSRPNSGLDAEKSKTSSSHSKINGTLVEKIRQQQSIQNLFKNKPQQFSQSKLLNYHQELIEKQYKKLIELQKQYNKTKQLTHSRGQTESQDSELKNKLINYIKKQSSYTTNKKIKGQRSISNPQIDVVHNKSSIIQQIGSRTQAGKLYTKETKTNQDSYYIEENFLSKKDHWIFQVSDGHGTNGHQVAQFIKEQLPYQIDYFFKLKKVQKNLPFKELDRLIQIVFQQSFEKTTQQLYQAGIDITFSGATTVTVLIIENNVWCANIGDSRAIIGRVKDSNTLQIVELSNDQKPDVAGEYQRIMKCGGRVQAYSDEFGNPVGPARVWLKEENIPGLAMSRSFGDYVASQVGVISVPEVIQHTITSEDKFLLVASDGIWEFLENEWICQTIYTFYLNNDCEGACDLLMREATKAWEREDEVIDDITLVLAFFQA